MGSSTRSSASILWLKALVFAAVGLALVGCSSGGIDGTPECETKKANLQGQVGSSSVAFDDSFSGGLEQKGGGTLTLTLKDAGTLALTWPDVVEDGTDTPVGGQLSLTAVEGGAVCVGAGSLLEVEAKGDTTFHLTSFTNCGSGGSLPGEIFGCVSFQ